MPPPNPAYRRAVLSIPRNGIGLVSSLALGDPGVVPLWFGESDQPTPGFIREAAKRALDQGRTFYTYARGLTELRQEIQRWTARNQALTLDLERISVPGSAMMSVNIALQLTVSAGDTVVIVSPIWPNIFNAVRAMGAEPKLVRLTDPPKAGGAWTLDLERLFAACDARTRAIFVCSPGNPTGWMIRPEEQRKILTFARNRGIAILADEVYAPLAYDRPHAPFAAVADPEDALFVVNSFSKAWAMTGWRVGWLIHPASLGPWVAELANIDNTGAATFAQAAAVTALADGDPFVAATLERCRKGRRAIADALRGQERVRWAEPEGAFYGFLDIAGMTDSLAFAKSLLAEHKVGVAPGMAFGLETDRANESYIRVCFAQDETRIAAAMERIVRAAAAL